MSDLAARATIAETPALAPLETTESINRSPRSISQIIADPSARLLIQPLSDGRRLLSVVPVGASLFVSRSSVITSYPDDLIKLIFSIKGPAYVCNEIARDEDPSYVEFQLKTDLLAYFAPEAFAGKRILDFGCGSGASTMILRRLFPSAEIIGVELDPHLLAIAKRRAEHYSFPQTNLLQSPAGTDLPSGLPQFDFVIMSAVCEHLLPEERALLLPKLWALVREGGSLFLDQTPHRYSPIESHTTGLPLINYLPDRLTHRLACRLSQRLDRDESWEALLRKGIRGSTEREVLRILRRSGFGAPIPLTPNRNGIRNCVDLWYAVASSNPKWLSLKKLIWMVGRYIQECVGTFPLPSLVLAVRKGSRRI